MRASAFQLRAPSIALAALSLSLGLAGCYPVNNLCDEQRSVMSAGGGELRCAIAEDCPRPDNLVVCLSEGRATEESCVACEDTRCVRYDAEPCR